MFSPQEVLDIAIRIEQNGEAVYRKAIQEVSDEALKAALQWMADEEIKHIEWLSSLKAAIDESDGIMADSLNSDLLRDLIGDQSFSLKDVDFSRIRETEALVRIFIEFENDGILFYEMLAPFVQNPATLSRLKQVIAEEQSHIRQLECFVAPEPASI